MTSPDLYDASYFRAMRGGGSLYDQFATLACSLEELRRSVVLDVGCGRGDLLKLFAGMGVRDIWGLDFSAAAIKQARTQLGPVLGEAVDERLRHGSIVQVDQFEAGSIDLAFMTDVVRWCARSGPYTVAVPWLKAHPCRSTCSSVRANKTTPAIRNKGIKAPTRMPTATPPFQNFRAIR